ncbi:DUF4062 domain-containing protein [Runella limosa]|uniref:DUF4062 domain-containing protein n=1 Tax=Runella limosa TaxID=370978 RepID=UPI00041C08C6|nr:DUF4062 domain-containing protein [Runella limosa]
MEKRLQVFVSSTFNDLKDEREDIMKTLLKLKCLPAGMEFFPATGESQLEYILPIIDESDIYIIIIAGKYGSISGDGLSYTETEFDYAVKKKKPILAFIHQNVLKLTGDKLETDSLKRKKLLKFIEKVKTGRIVNFWNSKSDLVNQVTTSLSISLQNSSSLGWVRFSDVTNEYEKREKAVDFDEVKDIKEKVIYYKMLKLESIEENPSVLYEKHIKRINKKIKIFSEYISIRIIKFDKFTSNFKGRDRTNGDAIEVHSLSPFHINIDDGDFRSNLIEPVIAGPTDAYVTLNHCYNGFKVGDFDLGLKAEKNIENARLVLDFSSIPNFNKFFPNPPKLFYNRFIYDNESEGEKLVDFELADFEIFSSGFFVAKVKRMRKNEALRFELLNDLETSSNVS